MYEGVRFVGYVRVSTEEQAEHGVSLEAQVDQLKAFAAAQGLEMVDVLVDAGKSAGTLDRPEMTRILAMMDAGEIHGVIVHKFDRLTRSVADTARLLDDYFHAGRPNHLITVSEGLDTKTPAGRMVAFVLAAMSQYEREMAIARTQGTIAHKRSKGQQLGHVPFGWRLGEDGETLEPCPADAGTYLLIKNLHGEGLSTREIAAELDRREIPRKRSGLKKDGTPRKRDSGRWPHSTVAEILTSQPPLPASRT